MLHIAICDDDRQVLDSLHEKLIKAAGDMVGAVEKYNSGEKLLFSFAGSKARIDVAILDIMLGNDNGIELAKRLREIRPETQVIFLSGHEDYFIQVYDVEHIYFLKKPVKEEDLRKAVELAKKNITVNCVSPGMIGENTGPTPYTWIGRWGRGEEVADLLLFLAGDDASFITGVDYTIDGGRILGPHGNDL